jgi:dienelactone hydrolase
MSSPGVLYYPHAISVAKIARVLLNTPESTPRWLDRSTPLLAAPGVRVAARGETGRLTNSFDKVAVLCHGYLGSRFDLVDLAEALANEGFLVIAPEFAESLASPSTTPAYARPGAPPPKNPSATRDEVVDAALRAFAPGFFSPAPSQSIDSSTSETGSVRVPRVVIAGQSAGASTATSARGPFAARVAIAGFRPPEALEAREALLRDPLLVVASAGDGVISLYPRESGAFGAYEGIAASVESMPARVPKYDVGEFAARVREMGTLNDADARRRAKETSGNALNAFLTYEPPGGDGGAMDGLPCHISFLSSRTNDAMVEVLSPLLPVARAIGVPVLDFDKYQTTRDSDAVNAELVPLIAEWLNAAVERR